MLKPFSIWTMYRFNLAICLMENLLSQWKWEMFLRHRQPLIIIPTFHPVNRLAYNRCKNEWPSNKFAIIEIVLYWNIQSTVQRLGQILETGIGLASNAIFSGVFTRNCITAIHHVSGAGVSERNESEQTTYRIISCIVFCREAFYHQFSTAIVSFTATI